MTGSGKAGLCIGLLEEAAADGILALAVDPKGGLPNVMLALPERSAGEFAPRVDPAEARKKELGAAAAAAAGVDAARAHLRRTHIS